MRLVLYMTEKLSKREVQFSCNAENAYLFHLAASQETYSPLGSLRLNNTLPMMHPSLHCKPWCPLRHAYPWYSPAIGISLKGKSLG
jgi:hypothetical protein